METLGDKFDYIIIGAGTVGSIITRILSDSVTNSILLLETGPNQIENRDVTDPNGYLNVQSHHDVVIDYVTNQDSNIKYSKTITSTGIGYGGKTNSNNMVAIRPSDTYLNKLQELTNIPADELKKYMNILEKYVTQPDTTPTANRGSNGILTVTQLPTSSSFYNVNKVTPTPYIDNNYPNDLATIYSIPNISPVDDYNFYELFVANRYQLFAKQTPDRWFRQDTGTQFLNPILFPNGTGIPIAMIGEISKRNLRVYDRTKVLKIHFKNIRTDCNEPCCDCSKRVRPYAVETLIDNRIVSFEARKAVIICCGAIETPLLLERSGIGSTQVLDSLGICPVIYNENLGNNLLGHYGAYMDVNLSVPLENNLSMISMTPDPTITSNLPQSIYNYAYLPQRAYQTYAYNFINTLRFETLQVLPRSSGSVHLNTKLGQDIYAQPQINYPTFATIDERDSICQLFRNLSVALNEYLVEYNTNIGPITADWALGDPSILSGSQIYSIVTANTLKENLVGTARMGTPGYGVVDFGFQVYGTCGLYIVDSSILPLAPDAQPDWLLMALGMYFAEKFKCLGKVRCVRNRIPKEVFMKERIVICRLCKLKVCKCAIITQYSKLDGNCQQIDDISSETSYSEESGCSQNSEPKKKVKRRGNIEFKVYTSD